jgi:hypothetical protein
MKQFLLILFILSQVAFPQKRFVNANNTNSQRDGLNWKTAWQSFAEFNINDLNTIPNGTTIKIAAITLDSDNKDPNILIVPPGMITQNVYYRVKYAASESTNEISVIRASIEKDNAAAKEYVFKLNQNYPNPFNPFTTILFSLAKKETVKLKIFDITGREIKTLVEGEYDAGEYKVEFNASKLSSGIYFYQITAGDFRETKKLQVLK